MNRFVKSILAIGAIVAAGGGLYYLHLHRQERAQEVAARLGNQKVLPPAVTVRRIAQAHFVKTVSVTGSLVPREEILVSPEIEGFRVLELFADEGSRVKKGDVLARLASDTLDAQVAQNTAALARADASIAQAVSTIAQVEARKREADAQLERAKPLKKSGYLSGSTYDQRESAARAAAAELTAAKEALTAAKADKQQLEAQRREIEWRQSKVQVTAPSSGVVSRRTARIGATASAAGEPLFRIIEDGQIELDAEIVETELGQVRIGQKAEITVPGSGKFSGRVRLVSPEVDPETRLGRVRILIGDDPALHIGAFARGRIVTATSDGLSVPTTAVSFTDNGAEVQLVEDDKIVSRVVQVGLMVGDNVEITDGLKDGDLVVQRSGTFLREGDVIRPILPDTRISEAR